MGTYLSKLMSSYQSTEKDIAEVEDWIEDQYCSRFSSYFKGEVELYDKLAKSSNSITDSELEWILTDVPLELFSVAEEIAKLKTAQEVIKMKIRDKEKEYIDAPSRAGLPISARKEGADEYVSGDKLLLAMYSALIDRVDRQVSFSRELIMSAKKIWDARRRTESVNPISEMADSDLPEYVPDKPKKHYIQ